MVRKVRKLKPHPCLNAHMCLTHSSSHTAEDFIPIPVSMEPSPPVSNPIQYVRTSFGLGFTASQQQTYASGALLSASVAVAVEEIEDRIPFHATRQNPQQDPEQQQPELQHHRHHHQLHQQQQRLQNVFQRSHNGRVAPPGRSQENDGGPFNFTRGGAFTHDRINQTSQQVSWKG